MAPSDPSLDDLRQEIDRIDAAIHDLIMERAGVVAKVAATKPGPVLRPGREAVILRRLMARHSGPFPKMALARIWREIMGAAVVQQADLTVAVYAPEGDPGYWELARDHFGTVAAMTSNRSAREIVRAVASGAVSAGIVPIPEHEEEHPWWRGLVGAEEPAPRVVARLPFTGVGSGPRRDLEAMALARAENQATGNDRSLMVLEAEDELSRARLSTALSAIDLAPNLMLVREERAETWLVLVEVDGFVGADDQRIETLLQGSGLPLVRVHRLGSYAVPFEAAALARSA